MNNIIKGIYTITDINFYERLNCISVLCLLKFKNEKMNLEETLRTQEIILNKTKEDGKVKSYPEIREEISNIVKDILTEEIKINQRNILAQTLFVGMEESFDFEVIL